MYSPQAYVDFCCEDAGAEGGDGGARAGDQSVDEAGFWHDFDPVNGYCKCFNCWSFMLKTPGRQIAGFH